MLTNVLPVLDVAPVSFTSQPCMVCGTTSTLILDADAFYAWRAGALVQNAFPNMSADDREILITGTHGACWDQMFANEE